MIKKLHFIILAMFVAGSLAAQSIPNGDFEQWDSVLWKDPAGYLTSNMGGNLPPGAAINVTQVAGYHANYGVQLSTVVVGPDTGFAFITNSNGNPAQGQGGIPYSQKPTGIRLYYKCNVMAGDSAGIMAVFKKSGVIIGTYYYTIIGTTASYTLFAKTFSPALAVTPDTVIFAATSSNAIFGGTGKPGSTLTIDSVNFTGVASQPALLNGDFETWQPGSLYMPHSWTLQGIGQRTTDKYAHNYAAELITGTPPGNGSVQPCQMSTGRLISRNHNVTIVPQFAYGLSKDTLVFYYKYSPTDPSDSAQVAIEFTQNASGLFWQVMQLKPAASYTKMTVPFDLGAATPDSVIVYFQSSMWPTQSSFAGADLKVDDVYFASQGAVGINEVNANRGEVKIYPNPANGMVYVNTQGYNGRVNKITVYDITGKAVITKTYTFGGLRNTITPFDMSGFNAGMYIFKINTDSGVEYLRVSKI